MWWFEVANHCRMLLVKFSWRSLHLLIQFITTFLIEALILTHVFLGFWLRQKNSQSIPIKTNCSIQDFESIFICQIDNGLTVIESYSCLSRLFVNIRLLRMRNSCRISQYEESSKMIQNNVEIVVARRCSTMIYTTGFYRVKWKISKKIRALLHVFSASGLALAYLPVSIHTQKNQITIDIRNSSEQLLCGHSNLYHALNHSAWAQSVQNRLLRRSQRTTHHTVMSIIVIIRSELTNKNNVDRQKVHNR